MKARHPKKYQHFLDIVGKMPEIFNQTAMDPFLRGRYFTCSEVPAYLRKAQSNGFVERIGDSLWRRTDMVKPNE